MATAKQIKLIHTAKSKLSLSDEDYRDILGRYGVESSTQLSERMAADLVEDLEKKAMAAGVWKKKTPPRAGKRPHNMDGRASRDRQMQKIEALLTVGGKSWSYADALSERICKVAKLAWVPTEDLYKIITALRKQAEREGWDLSGEG
ncbi:regulatory protein GemA [Desulfuromonas sp. TF]|uniref:regulatory protein GemA n=1 Tax=Desulfuromonas sp. TF TaxID=1232410 RepID=UPI000425E3FA|nr:regulatory protein GemA [Desulfuromonas sp. TF]